MKILLAVFTLFTVQAVFAENKIYLPSVSDHCSENFENTQGTGKHDLLGAAVLHYEFNQKENIIERILSNKKIESYKLLLSGKMSGKDVFLAFPLYETTENESFFVRIMGDNLEIYNPHKMVDICNGSPVISQWRLSNNVLNDSFVDSLD